MAWFGASKDEDVDQLIARKQFGKAIPLLEARLRRDPGSVRLRQQLADVLAGDGRTERAVEVLHTLVDEFAAEGFVAKAVAVLKKIQRLEPGQPAVEARLAELVKGRAAAAGLGVRPSAAPEPPPAAGPEPAAAPPAAPAPRAPAEPRPAAAAEEPPALVVETAADEAEAEVPGSRYSPLFSDLSESELTAVIGGLKLRVEPPGVILLTEGEPGDSLFILTTGWARVYRRDPTGRNQQVGMLDEGDFFGEAALLTGGVRTATVTAASDCELLELDRPTYEALLATYPRIAEVVREFHARRAGRDAERQGR
jgi:cAMP-dependent protein kinase regulator